MYSFGDAVETTMTDQSSDRLRRVNNQIMKAVQSTTERFLCISKGREKGNIAVALATECVIHTMVFGKTATNLMEELILWTIDHPPHSFGRHQQLGWDWALASIEGLIKTIRLSQVSQFLALARIIVESIGKLSGADHVLKLIEACDSLSDVIETSGIDNADFIKTGKILTTWEIYLMSGLLASQYAVMQVHALTNPNKDNLDRSLAELGKEASEKAKQAVGDRIVQVRSEIFPSGSQLPLHFPERGMWP